MDSPRRRRIAWTLAALVLAGAAATDTGATSGPAAARRALRAITQWVCVPPAAPLPAAAPLVTIGVRS
ncbi:MAG: hypothetical protein ACRETF_10425 [Nevskiaceae bacterium]